MTHLILTFLLPAVQAAVIRAPATVESDNVLRYTITAATFENATVAVQIWEYGSSVTSGWTTPYTTSNARSGTVNIWGLKPNTRYNYRVMVDPAMGANYTDTRIRSLTTAALPTNLPALTVTEFGGTPDFDYLLFDTRTTDTDAGLLMIIDPEGTPVWYEIQPEGDWYSSQWYSTEEEAIYVQVELDRIVRYSMSGAITLDWDMTSELQEYVHHEVRAVDGVVYTLANRRVTLGSRTVVEDGIQGYDASGALVYDWWANADGGLDPTANAPNNWERTGGLYGQIYNGAYDWTHANSLQIREENGDLKAYISFRELWQAIKVDMATGAIEWILGQNGGSGTEADGDFAMDASGVSTTWWADQHHTHYEGDDAFYIFDNSTSGTSRGLGMAIDESAMEVRIDRAVDFSDLVDSGFDGWCDRESSVYRTNSDHLVMTCGPEFFVAAYDENDTLTWTVDVATTDAIYRAIPLTSIGN